MHRIKCDEMSVHEKVIIKAIYKHVTNERDHHPRNEEMRASLCWWEIKGILFTLAILIGGLFYPVVWFSLLIVPDKMEEERERWARLFPRSRDYERVSLDT